MENFSSNGKSLKLKLKMEPTIDTALHKLP